jgi:hypothetical protein
VSSSRIRSGKILICWYLRVVLQGINVVCGDVVTMLLDVGPHWLRYFAIFVSSDLSISER